ncbi:MAG: iron-containing alcohol dehydrogenase [Flavobacteriaceae bacterium]|jgi:NADP-dependent alcohol dehydrogenase|nr:iron-containing alcohol dehydrogenase [Flavobacteriaceae bacterium]
MNNFTFVNPVKIIFGKNTIKHISGEIPANSKVLVTYGGGSIKRNGVYDQVAEALKGYEWYEFSGIEPNPHYETCIKAAALIKEKKVDYVLAVGGGSVIDATKFIVAAACFEDGDPWRLLSEKPKVTAKKAVPFGTVLTLPATASEMNSGAVITKASTQEKLAFGSPLVFPKFSILDPTVTFSLPPTQISNGVADAFVHVVEQYLTYPANALLQDFMAEAVLKTLIIEGTKALENPNDYDVRANIMWACTCALNGWIAVGVPQDWATHMIGHELTAFYGIDHAKTLAVVLPGVMTILKDQKAEKILRLGKEVFGIQSDSASELIDSTIKATEEFFHKLNIKTRLSDYGIGDEAIEKVVNRMKERGWKLGEKENITFDVVRKILELRK